MGIHAAADGEYDWRWYGKLVGAYFRNHPAGTPTATVVAEDTTDPSTQACRPAGAAHGRVVQLQDAEQPSKRRRLQPAQHAGRARPAQDGRVDVRGGRRVDGVDDDHPISWCQRYDGGRSWYTGLGHTQASFAEAGILSHIGAGIEIAAGVLPSAACGVAPPTGGGTDVEVPVGGTVPGVLALTFGATPSLGTFMPGVTKDYTASVAATVTSSAAAAALTVRDPSATATGRLVNGALAMPQALQVRAERGGVRAAELDGRGAAAGGVEHAGRRPAGDGRVQAAGRGHGLAAHGFLREDADLHAVQPPHRTVRHGAPVRSNGAQRP